MKPTLLVLAAGMGSRYGGLKQMAPMGPKGETVLDYSVYDAIRAGFGRVVFIIRKDFADKFKTQIGDKFAEKIDVVYVFQELNDLPEGFSPPEGRTKPWGTTHAILAARNVVDAPFAVINADDFYGADSFKQITSYFTEIAKFTDGVDHYCMVGYKLENTLSDHGNVNRGICSNSNGFLKIVEEHLNIEVESDGVCRGDNLAGDRVGLSVNALTSMNFWGFPRSIMPELERNFIAFLKERGTEMQSECFIPTDVDTIVKSGKADCKILETSSLWFGVTYPQDKDMCIASLTKLVEQGEYPANLWD
ncbi:MAG: sugar phosphate nucleotidyltransferase [Rubritalea sp.]|uniref:nucleotidyltransferase family protein n=1 Tax=Rubritalea sp. TaxID=2109375 RepID=UPI003241CDBB